MNQRHGFALDDITTLEGQDEAQVEDVCRALQRAINDGLWSLQGSYGRSMMSAITEGSCMLGERQGCDAYGNIIPSRTQVQRGTKGSREFVVQHQGEAWATMLDYV